MWEEQDAAPGGGTDEARDILTIIVKQHSESSKESPPAQPVSELSFRLPDGSIDREAISQYMAEQGQLDAPGDPHDTATRYEWEAATFLSRRIMEAQIAQGAYSWPDGLPWNQQPWWKMVIWQAFWAGQVEGRRKAHAGST